MSHVSPLFQARFIKSGAFGPKSRLGDLLVTKLSYPTLTLMNPGSDLSGLIINPTQQRHIVINLDISGSMADSMPDLIKALKTLKTVLGTAFGTSILISLITFSTAAKLVFSHLTHIFHDGLSYEDSINQIVAIGSTNLGAGLDLAHQLMKETPLPTWLITMSDGEANQGLIRSAQEIMTKITSMMSEINMATISLGYGHDHDSDKLSALGPYTHINSPEGIIPVISSCVTEALRAIIMRSRIITPSIEETQAVMLVGSQEGRVITVDEPYLTISLCHDQSKEVLKCQYIDLAGITREISTIIEEGYHSLTLEEVTAYFKSTQAKMLLQLKVKGRDVIQAIEQELADWPSTVAELSFYTSNQIGDELEEAVERINGYKTTVDYVIAALGSHHIKALQFGMSQICSGGSYAAPQFGVDERSPISYLASQMAICLSIAP
jgi:hypothetical protein